MKLKSFNYFLIVTVILLAIACSMLLWKQYFPLLDKAKIFIAHELPNSPHLYVPPLPTPLQEQQEDQKNSRYKNEAGEEQIHLEREHPVINGDSKEEDVQALLKFIHWSRRQGIRLAGVNKEVNAFYYKGAEDGDILPVDDIPNVLNAAYGLYEIPQPLLEAMRGKTLYLSHLKGRGYTVLGSWPNQGILVNVNRGSIIEQPISKRQTIHEFAHILDFHGIQGLYNDRNTYWGHLKNQRNEIFNVAFPYDPNRPEIPVGFMDVYSTANSAENFAQHFTFYILQGEKFRKKAATDVLLQEKYDFLKRTLFKGREY